VSTPIETSPVIAALLAMVEAALSGNPPLYYADSPRDAEGKYAVLYPDVGRKSQQHRNLLNDGPHELRYQITAIGVGPEQAVWVHDAIAVTLLTNVPVVAGRRCWPASQEAAQQVRRDPQSTDYWVATSQWVTRSDPA
jgi:hypothetical protein